MNLEANDGLYKLALSPLYMDDPRMVSLPSVDLTLADDPTLWNEGKQSSMQGNMKSPTRLGVWHCKVLSVDFENDWITRNTTRV